MRTNVLISAFVTSLVVAAPVLAQEGSATVTATTTTTTTAPAAAAPADTTPDHDKVVGKFGVGYLGQFNVPLANETRATQIIGIRYWLQDALAITGGVGFFTGSSTVTQRTGGTTVETEGPAGTAFSLKGGAAFALAKGRHYTFVIEPQLLFGYATRTIKGSPDTDQSGIAFAIGATAGAEIQFGFIGIPELALVASVGAALDTRSGKSQTGDNEASASQTTISTFTAANPWNIFAGNVAAIYYF